MVIGLNAENGPYPTARAVAGVLGARLDVVRHGPIFPTADQLQAWKAATGGREFYARSPDGGRVSFPLFAALLLFDDGQVIPLRLPMRSTVLELHFHGLAHYRADRMLLDAGAKARSRLLLDFLGLWPEAVTVAQADFAHDLIEPLESFKAGALHRALCDRHGEGVAYKETTLYYQSKANRYARVCAYDKQNKNALAYPLTRVEFSFQRQFWRGFEAVKPGQLLAALWRKAKPAIERKGLKGAAFTGLPLIDEKNAKTQKERQATGKTKPQRKRVEKLYTPTPKPEAIKPKARGPPEPYLYSTQNAQRQHVKTL
ncbi:MAG: hypothetical protein AB7E49_10685 [Campylobacterales bacterium]